MLTVGAYYQELGSKEGPPFPITVETFQNLGRREGFGLGIGLFSEHLRQTLARWAPRADNYTSEPMEVILKAKATHTHTHTHTDTHTKLTQLEL